jgi:hypothetical protein
MPAKTIQTGFYGVAGDHFMKNVHGILPYPSCSMAGYTPGIAEHDGRRLFRRKITKS